MKGNVVQRITRNAIMLALLCLIGMFSIPLGNYLKVSLQLWVVFLICFLAEGALDCIFITGAYLLLGLFMPIYAGFSAGVTPTFGFVISFVVASPIIHLLYRVIHLPKISSMAISASVGTLIVYALGAAFMCWYLNWNLGTVLVTAVLPYLPFDAMKIVLAVLVILALPSSVQPTWARKKVVFSRKTAQQK